MSSHILQTCITQNSLSLISCHSTTVHPGPCDHQPAVIVAMSSLCCSPSNADHCSVPEIYLRNIPLHVQSPSIRNSGTYLRNLPLCMCISPQSIQLLLLACMSCLSSHLLHLLCSSPCSQLVPYVLLVSACSLCTPCQCLFLMHSLSVLHPTDIWLQILGQTSGMAGGGATVFRGKETQSCDSCLLCSACFVMRCGATLCLEVPSYVLLCNDAT